MMARRTPFGRTGAEFTPPNSDFVAFGFGIVYKKMR